MILVRVKVGRGTDFLLAICLLDQTGFLPICFLGLGRRSFVFVGLLDCSDAIEMLLQLCHVLKVNTEKQLCISKPDSKKKPVEADVVCWGSGVSMN